MRMGSVENGIKYGEKHDRKNQAGRGKTACSHRWLRRFASCGRQGFIGNLAAFLLVLAALSFYLTVLENRLVQRELSEKVWRFHVVGDDDSANAQSAKMAVTRQMLDWLAPRLSDCEGRDEAACRMERLLPQAEEKAKSLAGSLGYSAAVCLTRTPFPAKTYGPYTLPAGLYDALEIRIGRAGGANWWCILYPGLCFSADSFSEDMDLLLRELLSEDSYRRITSGKGLNEILSALRV